MTPIKLFLIEPTGRFEEEILDAKSKITRTVYRRLDTNEDINGTIPAGALVYTNDEGIFCPVSEGKSLVAVVPLHADGSGTTWWNIDGKSNTGSGWTRTGTPPNITVTPSIFINPPNGFHGWIRNGEIVST